MVPNTSKKSATTLEATLESGPSRKRKVNKKGDGNKDRLEQDDSHTSKVEMVSFKIVDHLNYYHNDSVTSYLSLFCYQAATRRTVKKRKLKHIEEKIPDEDVEASQVVLDSTAEPPTEESTMVMAVF
jgi:hypothetical protein